MDRARWTEQVRAYMDAMGAVPPQSLDVYLGVLEDRLLNECRRKEFPEEAYKEMVAVAAYGAMATSQSGATGGREIKAVTEGDTRVEYGSGAAGGATLSPAAQFADAFQRFIWHWRVVPW